MYPPDADTGVNEYACEFLVKLDDAVNSVELSADNSATVIVKLLLMKNFLIVSIIYIDGFQLSGMIWTGILVTFGKSG